jgi:hypothetical protein
LKASLFDAYVIVDWSANSTPKTGKDSIWIGCGRRDATDLHPRPSSNPATREEAARDVHDLLRAFVAEGRRVLVGFDFPYGYPAGLADALRRPADTGPAWRLTWDRLAATVSDDASNLNNRFDVATSINAALGSPPGPFWGCPGTKQRAALCMKSPAFPFRDRSGRALQRYRRTEVALRASGRHGQETWKLGGVGSVGSQAIMGIPRVHALRFAPDLRDHSAVWPFETGFAAPREAERRPLILHAEIWPSLAPLEQPAGMVRDQAQVESLVRWLAGKDEVGELATLFDAPTGLTPDEIESCVQEEGWTLGATTAATPAGVR